ncbi:MAG: cytochrome c biogenesis protein ResB [Candidatus Competibacter sp.]|nr:cytochrome c biogenesis protein ResB [Candidatus Competibacter sp.]MDG4584208.1 cytochrome c biogenesis protein ResB [Candidatus Competibacter sp.]
MPEPIPTDRVEQASPHASPNPAVNETVTRQPNCRRTPSWALLEFFGSMNLAITLLVVVAVASAIGTVLQQNQPYPDYLLKFGPFWFEVFRRLGLYDVYGAGWFVAILAFLILSTSVCLYRQAPGMLREMVRFRTNVQVRSLRGFHQHAEWRLPDRDLDAVLGTVSELLRARGYRWRVHDGGDHRVVAAMKGRYNRFGYLFTHAAVVMIGIGGLLDGNLWLKLKEWRGEVVLETRDLAARDIPAVSRLAPGAVPAFRGNVMLPEGAAANFVFVRARDGFVLQDLPFAIELKDFQVAYYDTGQPKSFVSQVVIHDREHLGEQPMEATIRVNHPLSYRGYSIYQSDFGDGGSKLDLRAWPLTVARLEPTEVKGTVDSSLKVSGPTGPLTLELDDFRLFNLLPEPDAQSGERKFRNFGPSVGFKLRDAAGEAREYFNYMAPVQLEGRWFFISGMRARPGEPFTYLHIPADPSNSPERFLRFNARLRDSIWLRDFLARSAPASDESPEFRRDFERVRLSLVELFAQGGSAAVAERARAVVPAERLQEASALYLNILRDTLAQIFIEVLRTEGVEVEQAVGEREEAFFNDAVSALSALPAHASPFYLQLTGFQQVEASGLQVTHSGGVGVVYTGFSLLIIGVFIMFYTSHRRLWAWLAVEDGATRLLLAGTGNRRQAEFAREFASLRTMLERRLGPFEEEQSAPPTIPSPDTRLAADVGTR